MNYYRIAQEKYKRALNVCKIIRYVPGIRMVAVCNSLSYYKAAINSDIDLFIIVRKNRVWTARFFCIIILKLLNLRPNLNNDDVNPARNRNKICLSFILSTDNLDLSKYKICVQDLYLSFWIKQLKPMYDENNVYQRFVQSNELHNTYQPNYLRRLNKPYFKLIIELFGRIFSNRLLKVLQLAVLPADIQRLACAWDSRVIISDKILKFHLNDRRILFRDKVLSKQSKITG